MADKKNEETVPVEVKAEVPVEAEVEETKSDASKRDSGVLDGNAFAPGHEAGTTLHGSAFPQGHTAGGTIHGGR